MATANIESESSFLENFKIGRRQYLVTYSQADPGKFPTRLSFGSMLESEFNSGSGKIKVSHWACCREEHAEEGFHYHCCVKLSGVKKWLSVKKNIENKHRIIVNFSDTHNHYISAYRYVCKEDTDVQHSIGHPDLSEVGSPRTKASTAAYRRKRKESNNVETKSSLGTPTVPKRHKLTNLEVSDFIVANGIRNKTELFAIAEKRKKEGECDLAMFLFSRNEKNLSEIISKSWFLKNASTELLRENTSRMELIQDAAAQECHPGCAWLECAKEVLVLNKINVNIFAAYLREALTLGRGKFRNLMIIGRSNCAKTFMLKPLKTIFTDRVFENPSNDKYAWVGADKADIILLQDFRYSKELIPWNDLLLLLEGETVKLPAPKNHFISDVVIATDVPIFATSKSRLVYKGAFNAGDDRETEMMNSRWRVVEFTHVFAEEDQKDIPPCKNCFAKLVML